MNYNNINSIVNDYLNLTGNKKSLNKADIKYTANQVLKKLVDVDQYVPKIILVDIENYKISKPEEFGKIVQISYRGNTGKSVEMYEIVEGIVKDFPKSGCDIKLTKECLDCETEDCEDCNSQKMVVDVDRLWDLSHPEFRYRHMKWFHNYGGLANGPRNFSHYHNEFQLIKCTNDPLFSIGTHIKGCDNLVNPLNNCEVEYRVDNDVIRFNVNSGQILLSYLARPVDEQGYLLVPNIPDVYDAIKWTIEENMTYQEWRAGDRNAQSLYSNAMQRKLEAMGRARERLRTRSFTEMWKDLGNWYGKHLPVEDSRGNVTDRYDYFMDRLTRKQ